MGVDERVLCRCGILGNILFICVEFIRVQLEQGNQLGVDDIECGDSLFYYVFEREFRQEIVRFCPKMCVEGFQGDFDGVGVDFMTCEQSGTTILFRFD